MTQPSTLTLTPPAPVEAVSPDQAVSLVKLEPGVAAKLDAQVKDYVDSLLTLDVHSDAFQGRLNSVHTLGNADVQASAGVSNRLLERPVRAMEYGGLGETAVISNGLVQLRQTIDKLDPSRQGNLLSPRRLLGIIPLGSKLLAYFDKYRSAQTHLNAIIESLNRGQDDLQKDNASIEQEKQNMWTLMQRLEQWVYLGKKLDQTLTAKVATLEASDPAKAKIAKEEILFAVRQKVTDLLTQLAVNSQGYLALDLIRRNNVELIKGVDRATTTTVSALRTAVIVAQALANQKLVLDQITALNTTTGNIIEGTSRLLKDQSATIAQQASSATINIEQLQRAFAAVYETMDAIGDYKVKALDSMSKTVDVLSAEVARARKYLDRARGGADAAELTGTVGADGVVNLLPAQAGGTR
ncbi:MAG TPA: toxic anion resistance protein [Gemmatimonadales bacterium]|nr:toxic anion resistance protein [Gemmatimonadales bacterium]